MAKNGRTKTQANKAAEAQEPEGEEEEELEAAEGAEGAEGAEEEGPDEFDRAIAGAQSASAATDAPWWDRSEGARFWGRLMGMYYMGGNVRGPKEYLQVRCLVDTVGIKGKKGKDRKKVTVKAGQIISIGYNKALDMLFSKFAPMAEAGAVVNIGARVTGEKRATASGNDFWPMETFFKVVKGTSSPWSPYRIGSVKPTPNLQPGEGSDDAGGGDDIPF